MTNRYQLAFLGSFAVVFSSLFFLSRFIGAKLNAAGYRVSDLILIGLPKDLNTTLTEDPSNTPPAVPMADFASNTYAQLIALALTALTSAIIYFKFAGGSEFSWLVSSANEGFAHLLSHSAEKKPVLDPQVWQEFPLKEKIVVSPNTAM